jgi:hypothetical protein
MAKGEMVMSPSQQSETPSQGSGSREERYKSISTYEHHFNSLETELRKLASVWLLAALGAIAYLVRQNVADSLLDAKLLIAIVALMGNAGLLVLWILDQLVYHRLLNSVFLLGLRMEYKDRSIPPIRTLMMLFSRKRGMARFLRLFYLVPMWSLAAVSVIAGVWQAWGVWGDAGKAIGSLVVSAAAPLIPVWVLWRSANLESYAEVAEGFGDPAFIKFLKQQDYEALLQGH